MKDWWADSLAKRLFLLLWVTLLISHALGGWFAMPDHPPPWDAVPFPDPSGGPSHPPWPHEPPRWWLDLLIRTVIMGGAAWLGAFWLSRPLRQLGQATKQLGQTLSDSKERQRSDLMHMEEVSGPIEIKQLAHAFNELSDRLHDQFSQRSLLMGAVSHDLRTPLTRIRMRLEKMNADPLVTKCIDDVYVINQLIEGVLGALHEERSQEQSVPVDIWALVQSLADDHQESGHRVHAAGDGLPAWAQPLALQRILENLVGNAIRYAGMADMHVNQKNGFALITVEDSGPGIPDSMLNEVFKPFVRLDASRNAATGGVGLGLYIARELARRQGGDLTLSNRPQGGLCATLTLRLYDQMTTGSGSKRMPKRP